MLLIKNVSAKSFKGLVAIAPRTDAAQPLELFLRGTISPTVAVPTNAVVVMSAGELCMADGDRIDLSMWMSKDQATATSWCGPRFCPAMLVAEPRGEPKESKSKGSKGKAAKPKASDDQPTVTLALTSVDDEVSVPQYSTPIKLKIYSLRGDVPPAAAEEPCADTDHIEVRLQGPGIKRARAPEPDSDAKRHRATTLLFGSTGSEVKAAADPDSPPEQFA